MYYFPTIHFQSSIQFQLQFTVTCHIVNRHLYIHLYRYCFSPRIWFIYYKYIWTFFGFLYEDMRVHKCIWIQTERTISPNSQFIMCNPNWIATRRLLASIWIDAFDPKTHFQPKKRILKGTERLSFPLYKNTYINVTKNNYYKYFFVQFQHQWIALEKT